MRVEKAVSNRNGQLNESAEARRECVHGALGRSCLLCERDEEIERLRAELACRSDMERQLRRQVHMLARALLFYAKGRHYNGLEEANWEGPTGDDNWLCPPSSDENDLPTLDQYEAMTVEDGGYAASALRKTFGRKMTRYDHYRSLGRKARDICEQHELPLPCARCAEPVSR